MNNLKQLGLAAINFESRRQRYPGSQELLLPGTATQANPGYNKPASWMVLLLEDLDRSDIMERWNGRGNTVAPYKDLYNRRWILPVCPSANTTLADEGPDELRGQRRFMPLALETDLFWKPKGPANGIFLDRITPVVDPTTEYPQPPSMPHLFVMARSNTLLVQRESDGNVLVRCGPLDPTSRTFLGWNDWPHKCHGSATRLCFCMRHRTISDPARRHRSCRSPLVRRNRWMKINGEIVLSEGQASSRPDFARPSARPSGCC